MDDIQSTLAQLEKSIQKTLRQQERQANFEKEALQRFQANLDAFKQYFPRLHKQIVDFRPKDDFKVFVTPSGLGNFKPTEAPAPIYGDDPRAQTLEQIKRYTESATFGRSTLYKGSNAGLQSDKRLHMRYLVKLAETFKKVVSDDAALLETLPEHYPTCMMFGVGLGYALSALLDEHTFDYIFVCEPDFETFYASLYCTDWQAIFKKADALNGCIFLHVGITYETFFDEIKNVYNDIGAFSLISSFCYQHTPGAKLNALIKEFFARFYEIQLGYGFYNDAVTGLAHTIENFNDNECALFLPPAKQHSSLKGLTAYVVANGPSVDEAIELIRENKNEVVIFAAGTALTTLLKLGITPDFHVLVERPKNTYDVLVETVDKEHLKDLNLLAVDVMYPEVPPLYKWTGLGLKGPEAGTEFSRLEYYKTRRTLLAPLDFAGPLVANTALSFATMIGFGEVYLFGVDNGYPVSGQSHSSHSIYCDPSFKQKFEADKNAPHELEGNLEGHVKATSLMVQAKQQMEALIQQHPQIQFYNVGHGAKIKNAAALEIDDVLCAPLNQNKYEQVEKIKSSLFTEFSIRHPEQEVQIPEFESLCDYLLEIAHRPFSSRKEASDLLKAQARVVFAYRETNYAHLYHVIKGTMLYFHCPLISLLYLYEDEKASLQWFEKALAVWNDCVEEMKNDYRDAWKKRCEYSLEEITKQKHLNKT